MQSQTRQSYLGRPWLALGLPLFAAYCACGQATPEEPLSGEEKAALAIVRAAAEDPPKKAERVETTRDALVTVAAGGIRSAVQPVTQIAKDPGQKTVLRGVAFFTLAKLPGADRGRLREQLSRIVRERSESDGLRIVAAAGLGMRDVANPTARVTLNEVLLRSADSGPVQRACLRALAETAPLQKLRELLVSNRLSGHKYWGVRREVAVGLATLNVRTRRTLDILRKFIRESDPKDEWIQVPQEAILSYWVLTGRALGIRGPATELFGEPPKPAVNEEVNRRWIFGGSFVWDGVSKQMVEAVRDVVCKNFEDVRAAEAKGKRASMVRDSKRLNAVATVAAQQIEQVTSEWRADGAGNRK